MKNNKVNIVYGTDRPDYKTINKNVFTGEQSTNVIDLKGLNLYSEMVKDLRSCHFPIGYD